MSRSLGFALLMLVAGALVGCGSSTTSTTRGPRDINATPQSAGPGQKRFSAPGMAIHFLYPSRFVAVALQPSVRVAGSTARATHAGLAIGRYDLLIVSRYPGLTTPVTASNIHRLAPDFDTKVSQLLGRTMVGRVGTAGTLPAIFWTREPLAGLPVQATTEIVNAFIGDDEYELQCQATAPRLAAIEAACRDAITTMSASAAGGS